MLFKKITTALLVLSAVTFGTVFSSPASAEREVLLIVDASGSMKEKTSDGILKIDAAKKALHNVLPKLNGDQVGLLLFGHRVDANKIGCCQDIELAIPIGPVSPSEFTSIINRVEPLGKTPLAQSLFAAKDVLLKRKKDVQKTIIVLTDGNETCNGDPQAAAAELAKMGINVRVHVVGFAVNAEQERELQGIAKSGNGKYASAQDAASLIETLQVVVKEPVAEETNNEVGLSRLEAALVARLKDKDYNVRISAAKTLKNRNAIAAVPFLIEATTNDDWIRLGYAKTAILEALNALAPNEVPEALYKATSSKNDDVRNWAVAHLGRVNDPSTATTLSRVDRRLVEHLSDSDYSVRISAADSLRQRKTSAAVPFLIKSVKNDEWIRLGYAKNAMLKSLKELAPNEVEEALLAAMDSKNGDVRAWATTHLSDTGS